MRWQKDDLVHHFVEALDQAEVTHAPFSHLFAQNLFPQDVYQHLMTLLPVIDGYKPLNHRDAMREDGTSTREVMPFNDAYLGPLPEEQREFLQLLKSVLDDRRVGEKYFELLAPDLAKRTSASIPDQVEAFPKSGLFRDASGYKIQPHKDINTKIVTTQLYLPADESQREFGTTLYKRSLKGRIIRELNKISSTKRREFEQLKTFPFLPNSGYAFIVGKKSWHGREPVPEGLGSRFSLMNIYYNHPNVPFYDK
ncbi:MAG: hypothetical protein VXX21_05320 [Pseudomonadota bacterium]|nr:hypothetical protein [Pseudomonadota bacterium]